MSSGFADKSALEGKRRARRFKTFDWEGIGKVVLQSPMAGEWIKIDAARARVRVAVMQGRKKDHEASARDLLLETLYGLVLNEDHSAFFTRADEALILELDPADTEPLVAAALEFAEIRADVGDSQKNSSGTSEGDSPSSSGGS